MTQKARTAAVAGIGAAAAGILTLVFFLTFEKKTETVRQGGKPQVIRDDWSALARTVSSRDFEFERLPAGTDFWNGDCTAVFCGPAFMDELDSEGMESLDLFIGEYGGRLVVCGLPEDLESYRGKPASALLDICGIDMEPASEQSGETPYAPEESSMGTMAIEGRDGELPVLWGDGRPIPLAAEAPFLSKGTLRGSPRWIQAEYGEGSITFCSDSDFFRNSGIAGEGHAEMLAWLLPGDAVYELVGIEDDTVTMAEKRFPWGKILLPLAVFCGMLVWSRAPRFGPVRETAGRDRRSISERFAAEGGFLWSRTAPGTLAALMLRSARDRFVRIGKKDKASAEAIAESELALPESMAAKPTRGRTDRQLNAGEFMDLMNRLEAGGRDTSKDRRKT